MAPRKVSAIVLAAGEGTRMRSPLPKPLHRLCGRPMVLHVLDALAELAVERVVVVVGYRAIEVEKVVRAEAPEALSVEFVEQTNQRGTGDAVAVALTGFSGFADLDDDDDLVVLPGDTPLVRPATLAALVREHRASNAAATLLTARLADPTGYGRVVRNRDGNVAGIVEHVEASDDELAIDEVNTSIYCFRHLVLAPALRRLTPSPTKGEYYLTDVVGVLADAGYPVTSLVVADSTEAAGVNDRAQLAAAGAELRSRINERWMRRGVTMVDPDATYVETAVEIGEDVTLYPGVVLEGSTRIGPAAVIGPRVHLVDTTVGARARMMEASATSSRIGEEAVVGPYVALEEGTVVEPGAHVPAQGSEGRS